MKANENLPISEDAITITGARQNNLKNLTLALPLNELIVVTGVSGSGKSSLVFDTLYAEGQRRYVETFSPYARQFLDRMDKPQVDAIHGIPPAIAIDQTNPVRTSRSTVGTMTELNDHLKLLFARTAQLFCRGCGRSIHRDTPDTIYAALAARAQAAGDPRLIITFPVPVPKNFSDKEVKELLAAQGYTRFHREEKNLLEVVQDRLRLGNAERVRVIEALEAALRVGMGRVNVYPSHADAQRSFESLDHAYSFGIAEAEAILHHLEQIFFFTVKTGVTLRSKQFLDFLVRKILRHRHREGDDQARVAGGLCACGQCSVNGVRRIAMDGASAAAAEQLRRAREQELQVVVQLRHGADRRARSAHRVGLVDRDGRRYAVYGVDLRLVHAVEELSRVWRKSFDVAALAFRVERVEHQRRFARARHAGDDDQLVQRECQREVFEIVLARTRNGDRVFTDRQVFVGFHRGRICC